MSEQKNSSSTSPIGQRLLNAVSCGALVGLLFSVPDVNQTYPDFSSMLMTLLLGSAGAIVLFGLPAGLILGFLDRRRGIAPVWRTAIKTYVSFVGGFALLILLMHVLWIPRAIGILAHSGSEWLAGAPGKPFLMRVIGVFAGACLGLIVGALLIAIESINAKVAHGNTAPYGHNRRPKF